MTAGSVWAVVVAAGSGTRFGSPKQFELLAGRPVVQWAVAACRRSTDGVVRVVPPGTPDDYGADVVTEGGATRSASVRCGLARVPDAATVVVVHDAARPLASDHLFRSVLAALDDATVGGALCAVPVRDTVKRLSPAPGPAGALGDVAATVERTGLVAVQTPQAFRAPVLRQAHAGGGDATDDASLVEALGATERVVPGDPRNIKLTTPDDLAYAERELAR